MADPGRLTEASARPFPLLLACAQGNLDLVRALVPKVAAEVVSSAQVTAGTHPSWPRAHWATLMSSGCCSASKAST